MKLQLCYWPGRNFGDEMNIWLWSKLLPHIVDTENTYNIIGTEPCNRPLFVGIGTLLNDRLPISQQKIIFGSGIGYFGIPSMDDTWKVYFVRGPLTARKLGLNGKYITDPAALIATINLPDINTRYKYSFMPHHSSVNTTNWQRVCDSLSINYIDPTLGFEQCLKQIRASEIIIAEAMHAAIVADALRIRWIPVNFHKSINSFKWHDWCQSLNLEYEPQTLNSNIRFIKRKIPILPGKVNRIINYPLARRALKLALQKGIPMLSLISILESATDQLMQQVDNLSRDFNEGI